MGTVHRRGGTVFLLKLLEWTFLFEWVRIWCCGS